ncbi:hypothetical protein [Flavobacterium sp. 2]|uniref:hypothetical protein n=1 Tax=Flavobacterium sp. 2 TaxID=308053 RepID=UPI003CF4D61F
MILNTKSLKVLIYILILFVNISCKTNDEKIDKNITISEDVNKVADNNNLKSEDTSFKGESYVFYKAYYFQANANDIPEFSENQIISKFKKINIKLSKDTISIDNVKSYYSIEKKNSRKFFTKEYLYAYYVDAFKNGFNIDVKDTVSYINLDIENNDKSPFVDYFLEAGDAVFMNSCLFLNFGRYIICFKSDQNKVELDNNYCGLPFDLEQKDKLANSNKEKFSKVYPKLKDDKFLEIKKIISESSEGDNADEIFQINNGGLAFDSFLYCIYGDSDSQTLINIKNDKIIAKEAIGYAMPENETYQSFVINKDLTIDVYDINYNSLSKKFLERHQIKQDGSIVKIR